jgi:hypothetical protein
MGAQKQDEIERFRQRLANLTDEEVARYFAERGADHKSVWDNAKR